MVKHLSGKLILFAGAAIAAGHHDVSGQHYFHEEQPVHNGSCAVGNCPTNFLTYGFFHENWRRWPEEMSAEKASALNPFVVPDRDAARPLIPSPRDEASQVPRKRQPIEARSDDASVESSAPSAPTAPPQDSGPSGLMGLEGLPTDEADAGNDTVVPTIPDLPDDSDLFGPPGDNGPGPLPEETEDEFDLDSLDLSDESSRPDRVTTTPKPSREPSTRHTAIPVAEPRQLPHIAARELGQEVHHVVASVDQVAARIEVSDVASRRNRNPLRQRSGGQRMPSLETESTPAKQTVASASTLVAPTVPAPLPRRSRIKSGRSNPLRR